MNEGFVGFEEFRKPLGAGLNIENLRLGSASVTTSKILAGVRAYDSSESVSSSERHFVLYAGLLQGYSRS